MIYVEMINGIPQFFDSERPNSMPIDDDYENVFLYHYDKEANKIIKKTGIDYTIQVDEDGNAVVVFESPIDVYINIEYRSGLARVHSQGFAISDGKVAKLKLDVSLNCYLIISSLMPAHVFIPIEITSDEGGIDDFSPTISCIDNVLTIKEGFLYSEIKALKKEIQLLKGE